MEHTISQGDIVRVNKGIYQHDVLAVWGDWVWVLRKDCEVPQSIHSKYVQAWED